MLNDLHAMCWESVKYCPLCLCCIQDKLTSHADEVYVRLIYAHHAKSCW